LIATSAASADTDEGISTDRPDFVESSATVGKGVFQIETSVAFERTKQDSATSDLWTTPTLLRYGVLPNLELRLETDGFARSRIDDSGVVMRENGFSDVSLGIKWHQKDGDEASATPAIAWLLHVDLDSGSLAFRGPGKVPSLRMVAEWELAGDASLGIMPGIAYDKDDHGERYWAGTLAATYGRPLAEKLRGFIELAGQHLATASHGGSVLTADTGIAYAIDKNTQIDTAFFFGLNKNSPDVTVTVGFSKRFP
jgi:hypothetical protein